MSTPPGPFASPESAALRPIQMVSVAVGMGALMLSAVRILVDPSAPLPSPWAVGIVLATLVGSATLIRYVGYAVPALPHGLPRENAEATSLRYFTSTTTLRTALAEAPVLVAFACSFVFTPHSWLTTARLLTQIIGADLLTLFPVRRSDAALMRPPLDGVSPS